MFDLVDGFFKRRYSLRRRLLAVSFAAFVVLITLLAVGIWAYARTAANETYDLLLRGAAISMLERITVTPEGIEIDLPPSAFEILALNESDRIFYRVIDENGQTLPGDGDLPGAWIGDDDQPRQEAMFFDETYSGEPVRFVVNGRLLPGADTPQCVGVQIGQTRRARDAMQSDLMLKGIVPLAALSLAGIERDTRERQPLDLEPLRAEPPREIEGLIAAINGFMRRLGQSRKQAETFIADVAHQTRTSLAMLQAHLDAADRKGEVDIVQLRRAREQAGRTVRMTNQLLSHAMVIHRADREMFAPVDLREVILRLLEESVRDNGNGVDEIEFGVDLPDDRRPAVIEGDAVAIREALRNLIDNAIRHGSKDNEITIGLKPLGVRGDQIEAYEVSVEDRGPGIAAEEKLKVLERFYSTRGGSGIGLSIVAAVAASHGGRLELQDAVPQGLRSVMRLSVAPQDRERS